MLDTFQTLSETGLIDRPSQQTLIFNLETHHATEIDRHYSEGSER